jgi:alcohol dehydrogenase class IV
MEEINAIMQYAQIANQMGPEGQMSIKVGETLDMIAEKLGIPQRVRMTPEERMMKMQEMAQMAQQAAEQNPEMAAQVATKAIGAA